MSLDSVFWMKSKKLFGGRQPEMPEAKMGWEEWAELAEGAGLDIDQIGQPYGSGWRAFVDSRRSRTSGMPASGGKSEGPVRPRGDKRRKLERLEGGLGAP